ncbi:MAG: hypothetical protein JXO44_14930 [Clostridia bacterium]|nr:hypothetical protein [Clostridia bacterium]
MRMRRGFTILDFLLTLGLLSLLFFSFNEVRKAQKIDQTHISELRTLQSLDLGFTASFEDIVRTYSPSFAVITDASTTWGWNSNNKVSPFPSSVTIGDFTYIEYRLDDTDISATQLQALKGRIIGNYRGACEDWTNEVSLTTNNLYLYCEDVVGFNYTLSDGTTGLVRPNALGDPIDPGNIPTVMVSFRKKDGAGNFAYNDTYTISFANIYEKQRVITANRLAEMRSAIENFTNAVKLREIANVENADQSGGLNNMDDEFVGWHWKAFGNDLAQVMATFCSKAAGGGTCNNLNSNDIWRSGIDIDRGLIARRFVTNLMQDDQSYLVDGFGNGIYIYPTASQCDAADYMDGACTIDALDLPEDNYMAKAVPNTPPYVTVIFTEPYRLKATAGQPYGRVLVAY